MTEMSERIKLARIDRGMTQKALAERLGITRPAVTQWETGTVPEKPRMAAIAEVLNVDEGWLSGFGDRLPIRRNTSSPLDSALLGATLLDWNKALDVAWLICKSNEFYDLPTVAQGDVFKRLYVMTVKNPSKLNEEAVSTMSLGG